MGNQQTAQMEWVLLTGAVKIKNPPNCTMCLGNQNQFCVDRDFRELWHRDHLAAVGSSPLFCFCSLLASAAGRHLDLFRRLWINKNYSLSSAQCRLCYELRNWITWCQFATEEKRNGSLQNLVAKTKQKVAADDYFETTVLFVRPIDSVSVPN